MDYVHETKGNSILQTLYLFLTPNHWNNNHLQGKDKFYLRKESFF